jgi:LysM repeat protein
MVARNRLRYLAPIALAVAIAATIVVANTALSGKKSATHSHVARHRAHKAFANARFYTVQNGDSLSSISVKTGIPVQTLESLNPSVDPNAVQTGQRLRLRR